MNKQLRLDWIDMLLFVGVVGGLAAISGALALDKQWMYACVALGFGAMTQRRRLFPSSLSQVERPATVSGFFAAALTISGALAVLTVVLLYANVYGPKKPPTRDQVARDLPEVSTVVIRPGEDPEQSRRKQEEANRREQERSIDVAFADALAHAREEAADARKLLFEILAAGVVLVAVGAGLDRFRR